MSARAAIEAVLAAGPLDGPWTINPERIQEAPLGGEWAEIGGPKNGGFAKLVWRMEDDKKSPVYEATANYVVAVNPMVIRKLLAEHDAQVAELCAEITDLRAQLDAVRAGGVSKLMSPAAQPAERTATEQEAVDRLIAHVEQHHKIKTGEQRNFEALVASLIVAVRMGSPPAAQQSAAMPNFDRYDMDPDTDIMEQVIDGAWVWFADVDKAWAAKVMDFVADYTGPAPVRQPLSHQDVIEAIDSCGSQLHGRILLSFARGTESISTPTHVAMMLARAIEAKITGATHD